MPASCHRAVTLQLLTPLQPLLLLLLPPHARCGLPCSWCPCTACLAAVLRSRPLTVHSQPGGPGPSHSAIACLGTSDKGGGITVVLL
ncbi:hypothetical protein V8C86DRAFT_1421573 [Haematococcus lacustris]